MTVFLVNRFFYPDHSATSQHFCDLAAGLQRAGLDIVVVSSRQLIDDPQAGLARREAWQGVAICRVGDTALGRGRIAARLLDYLSFALAARTYLSRRCGRGDVVIVGTDPPMLSSVVAGPVAARGGRLFNWLHDLFPEVAQAMAMRGFNSPPGKLLAKWRDRALLAAERNVVIGPRMYRRVAELGVPAAKLALIHNWADGARLRPIAPEVNPLRREWRLTSQFVVSYSGNFGVVHEFETLLGAMRDLHGRKDISFLFIGGGKRRAGLERAVQEAGLSNTLFKPYQPRAVLGESLGAADVHLISLRPALEGLVLPSKLYGILAAGRPAIHIGDPGGDVAGVLAQAGCGYALVMGDSGGLSRCIRELADAPGRRVDMGHSARRTFDEKFDLPRAVEQWLSIVQP